MIDQTSWIVAYPEIVLLAMACVITLWDVSVADHRRGLTYALTQATLISVAILQAAYLYYGFTRYGFGGMLVSDPKGNLLKCAAALAMAVTLVYARPYSAQRGMLKGGEMYILSLFSLLGMFVMISANNLLIVYIGLELLTLSSYALVALRRDHANATEAAMKYFVLGSLASGFLLYGLSMLYGATGSLMIHDVFASVHQIAVATEGHSPFMAFAIVFIMAGLAFKFGAVPFHMWMPDVYDGAPTSVTLLVASAPKLAAFAMMMRLMVEGLFPLAQQWQQIMAVLAVASLLVGNLAAIMQTNIKRMLAYSTIAQIGFVFLAFTAGAVGQEVNPAMMTAYPAGMFYVLTYVLTTLVSFGILMLLSNAGFECENISDLAGLNQRSPLFAGVMAVSLLSLAGIPPMVGFYAKLVVIQSLLQTGQIFSLGLAVFAVLMSLVGAFYYLRVIKVMYFDAPASTGVQVNNAAWDVRAVLALNGGLILVLGLLPAGLMKLCVRSIFPY